MTIRYNHLYKGHDDAEIAMLEASLSLIKHEIRDNACKIIESIMPGYKRIEVINLYTDMTMHYIIQESR